MFSQFFLFCRFHVFRLLRAQPVVAGGLILSSVVVVLASLAYLQQWQQSHFLAQQLSELRMQAKQVPAVATSAVPMAQASFDYPPFHSAKLVESMTLLAAESKLPINEVSYGLDDNANQPYLRYRVRLTVISNYPVIRRYVDQLPITLPNVALESISCGREGISATLLKCELAFSAIFRKEAHE